MKPISIRTVTESIRTNKRRLEENQKQLDVIQAERCEVLKALAADQERLNAFCETLPEFATAVNGDGSPF